MSSSLYTVQCLLGRAHKAQRPRYNARIDRCWESALRASSLGAAIGVLDLERNALHDASLIFSHFRRLTRGGPSARWRQCGQCFGDVPLHDRRRTLRSTKHRAGHISRIRLRRGAFDGAAGKPTQLRIEQPRREALDRCRAESRDRVSIVHSREPVGLFGRP